MRARRLGHGSEAPGRAVGRLGRGELRGEKEADRDAEGQQDDQTHEEPTVAPDGSFLEIGHAASMPCRPAVFNAGDAACNCLRTRPALGMRPVTFTVTLPSLGESIAEAEVGRWLVAEGQLVEKDQELVEVLTDKADSALPSPVRGVVTRIWVAQGERVRVGARLCDVDPDATAAAPEPPSVSPARADATSRSDAPPRAPQPAASPSVRRLAREADVDLSALAGTGERGRVTREDVERAARAVRSVPGRSDEPRAAVPPPASASAAAAVQPSAEQRAFATAMGFVPGGGVGPRGAFRVPPYVPRPGDEVVPFGRRRRIIADHMVYSKLTSPHVVTFAECDMAAATRWRQAHRAELERVGIPLTYLALIAAATCRALREYRIMNARVLDDAYVLLRDVHLGIAVDTPEGLVVPVIPNADELSVSGLARAIDELARKARDGSLTPDELSGKTFTISNPGKKGNLVGGAIISQPNVGILRTGEIRKRPVVVERDGEDLLAIHPVMYVALSYDHRIVDGVQANAFLHRIVELLEAADFRL
ncbi:MAG: 2-oxo acid dehydrogenase subunit E2 [Myxococcota bacterium]|nr:2-oxo acid dehydrogenase subunit E2 [Myxococcota bacterium]MDW8364103.1 dihydrolipoamide acetyltransferase family protein [Myxococcales bacterium]